MSTPEPDGWSFSNTKFKVYESFSSSSDDSSDDEDLFSKTKTIKKIHFVVEIPSVDGLLSPVTVKAVFELGGSRLWPIPSCVSKW